MIRLIKLTRIARICCFITVGITGALSFAGAQWVPESLLTSPLLATADSNCLSLRMDMSGFFYNSEYFSPMSAGRTYPGITTTATLKYQHSSRFRAEAGAYAVKFSGRNRLTGLQPFLSLQYSVSPSFHIVMGNFYGGLNHRCIEPLYQWERHLVAAPESGLQLLWSSDRLFADMWIDWQQYIERNDPFPEVLTFGMSAAWQLCSQDDPFRLSLPVQLLIYHRGGQIDNSDEKMVVMGNMATGLCGRWNIDRKWLRSAGLDFYFAGYHDRYPDVSRPYREGWGLYPVLHLNAAPFALMTGFWHGERFFAFQGESLFGSFNPYDPEQQIPIRHLLTVKFSFEKALYKCVFIGARIETYSDLKRGKTDYSFGVNIRFNRDFFLKRF
jgi:hypothetical protein